MRPNTHKIRYFLISKTRQTRRLFSPNLHIHQHQSLPKPKISEHSPLQPSIHETSKNLRSLSSPDLTTILQLIPNSPMASQVDAAPVTDAPNRGYELSGKIMLSAIVILFAVVIFMVCLHLYARWYLIRARRRQLQRRNRNRRNNIVFYVDSPAPGGSRGLDSAVLNSLPVFVFNGAEDRDKVSECAVCLSEFEEGEKGRSLPKCKHSFHIDCIDMWFASHSTCPLCRAPVESIAEVRNAEQEIQVVVVESAGQTESGANIVPAVVEPVSGSTSSSSIGARRNDQVELKGFSIEIPRRSDPTEIVLSTASPQAFKSPGGRMMSLRRILSRGLSMSSSPSTAGVSGSVDCCDLETGITEETSREPIRTQSSR